MATRNPVSDTRIDPAGPACSLAVCTSLFREPSCGPKWRPVLGALQTAASPALLTTSVASVHQGRPFKSSQIHSQQLKANTFSPFFKNALIFFLWLKVNICFNILIL